MVCFFCVVFHMRAWCPVYHADIANSVSGIDVNSSYLTVVILSVRDVKKPVQVEVC